MRVPKWFDWPHWGLALGSDQRYRPRWYERRAYVMGLRDAARITEAKAWERIHIESQERHRVIIVSRSVIRALHAYVREFMNLPPDASSGVE